MSSKLIILDRDGVINHDSDDYIKSPKEWLPIGGSIEAIAKLKQNGYFVAVATNQSGIGRGYYTEATMELMHEKLANLLKPLDAEIDLILHCPHTPEENCACRKPKPAMLTTIAQHFEANLSDTYFVGDTLSDLATARAAGTQFALVKTGKGARILDEMKADSANADIPVFEDLSEFVDSFLQLGGHVV